MHIDSVLEFADLIDLAGTTSGNRAGEVIMNTAKGNQAISEYVGKGQLYVNMRPIPVAQGGTAWAPGTSTTLWGVLRGRPAEATGSEVDLLEFYLGNPTGMDNTRDPLGASIALSLTRGLPWLSADVLVGGGNFTTGSVKVWLSTMPHFPHPQQ